MRKGVRIVIALRAHSCSHILLTVLGLGSPGHQSQSPVKRVFLTHSVLMPLDTHVELMSISDTLTHHPVSSHAQFLSPGYMWI